MIRGTANDELLSEIDH